MRDAHDTAHGAGQAAVNQNRTRLQRDDRADEKRQHADHQQTRVANFKKLVEDLLPLPPRQRQGQQRAPKQKDDFADAFKHSSGTFSFCRRACRLVRFDQRNIKQAQFFALRIGLILKKTEKERAFFRAGFCVVTI